MKHIFHEQAKLDDHRLVGAEFLLIVFVNFPDGGSVGHTGCQLAGDCRNGIGWHQAGQNKIEDHGKNKGNQKPHDFFAKVLSIAFHSLSLQGISFWDLPRSAACGTWESGRSGFPGMRRGHAPVARSMASAQSLISQQAPARTEQRCRSHRCSGGMLRPSSPEGKLVQTLSLTAWKQAGRYIREKLGTSVR